MPKEHVRSDLSISIPGLVMCSTAIMAPNLKYHQRQVPLAPFLYVTCQDCPQARLPLGPSRLCDVLSAVTVEACSSLL